MDNQFSTAFYPTLGDNHLDAQPQNMSWQQSMSPPNSSSSMSSGQSLYNIPDTSPERNGFTRGDDYPTSASAAQSAYLPRTLNAYPSRPQDAGPSDHAMAFGPPQLESSIGPARNTRRRARAEALRRGEGPSDASDQAYDRHNPSVFTPHFSMADSPSLAEYPQPPISHARSSSSSSNPRSTSPAMSLASSYTSLSTHSAPNSRSHPPLAEQSPSPLDATMARPKHRKQRLYSADRKKICLYHMENPNLKQDQIASHFGVERSTVSKILKQKEKWMSVSEDQGPQLSRARPSKHPALESDLATWMFANKGKEIIFTDNLIRTKALELAKGLRIPLEKFKASSGWVENFKHRMGIRRGVYHGNGVKKAPPFPVDPNYREPPPAPEYSHPQLNILPERIDEYPDRGVVVAERDEHGNMRQRWNVVTASPLLRGRSDSEEPPPLPEPYDLPPPVAIPIAGGVDGEGQVTYLQPVVEMVPPAPLPTINEMEPMLSRLLKYSGVNDEFFSSEEKQCLHSMYLKVHQAAQGLPIDHQALKHARGHPVH